MTQSINQPKQWSEQQANLFAQGAVNILSALKSTFTDNVLYNTDGSKKQQIVDERVDTPLRFAKMMMEMLEGELYTNDEIVDLYKDKVFITHTEYPIYCTWDKIKTFSFCEHHIALMYDITINVQIDYTNLQDRNVKVIGLSKIPRICDLVCKRLQLQEKITSDIHYIVQKLLGVPIIVTVEGKHSCVSARGAKKDIVFHSQIKSCDSNTIYKCTTTDDEQLIG